ncbi:MAG: M20/M25/M40 family metallo-hydrolase, partial [Planctomycetota bacterium]|nr:M20/M25/M40 family metallo-hydrolase [Planctomycetota bacterium]
MRVSHSLAVALVLAGGSLAQETPPAAPVVSPSAPAAAAPARPLVASERSKRASAGVQEASLMETLRAFPLKRSAIGGPEHEAGLKATQEMIVAKLKEMGFTPVLHEFTWTSPAQRLGKDKQAQQPATDPAAITYHNISIDLKGSTHPNEVLVVGGHFDAVPMGPGADDNASGAAAVLELARVYKDLGQPDRTIRLMWFNLEENGLVGARAYVTKWAKDQKAIAAEKGADAREHIVGMLSLEMLGYYSDAPNSQSSPIPPIKGTFEPSTVGDTIAVVGIKTYQSFSQPLMKLMTLHEPAVKITSVDFMPIPIPDMMRSDHQPFVVAGLPGVMITDTANFRNPNYHKATDTVETIDAVRYARTVRSLAGAVW